MFFDLNKIINVITNLIIFNFNIFLISFINKSYLSCEEVFYEKDTNVNLYIINDINKMKIFIFSKKKIANIVYIFDFIYIL